MSIYNMQQGTNQMNQQINPYYRPPHPLFTPERPPPMQGQIPPQRNIPIPRGFPMHRHPERPPAVYTVNPEEIPRSTAFWADPSSQPSQANTRSAIPNTWNQLVHINPVQTPLMMTAINMEAGAQSAMGRQTPSQSGSNQSQFHQVQLQPYGPQYSDRTQSVPNPRRYTRILPSPAASHQLSNIENQWKANQTAAQNYQLGSGNIALKMHEYQYEKLYTKDRNSGSKMSLSAHEKANTSTQNPMQISPAVFNPPPHSSQLNTQSGTSNTWNQLRHQNPMQIQRSFAPMVTVIEMGTGAESVKGRQTPSQSDTGQAQFHQLQPYGIQYSDPTQSAPNPIGYTRFLPSTAASPSVFQFQPPIGNDQSKANQTAVQNYQICAGNNVPQVNEYEKLQTEMRGSMANMAISPHLPQPINDEPRRAESIYYRVDQATGEMYKSTSKTPNTPLKQPEINETNESV